MRITVWFGGAVCRRMLRLTLVLLLGGRIFCTAHAQAPDAPPAPTITITIDDTAVRELLDLADLRDTSDTRLEKWLDLPANRNLLRVGGQEENLSRADLKANALAVITGTASEETQPRGSMGRLLLSPRSDYRKLLADLKATLPERLRVIATRVAAFSPPGTSVSETVYLHLGGDWDALNYQGAVYINLHFWHDYHKPGWEGLNMVIAHESMHTVQNAAYGNPESQSDGDSAFFTALSKIQREGTARYVETDTDAVPYEPYSYGFHYRAIDLERLRGFATDMGQLQRLYESCYPRFDREKFVQEFTNGVNDGGPYYGIGHGMAKAIDEHRGRKSLIETVKLGPREFFLRYQALTRKSHELPPLPPAVVAQIQKMKARLPQ